MHTVLLWAGAALATLGTAFTCLAALGIVRFRQTLDRQHAATKPQMLGFILVMIAVMLVERSLTWTAICLLAIALQGLTAPLSAHILARAAWGRQWRDEEAPLR